ncbi:MAG: hypothetical protein LUF04_07015, partial [Bacteroides sp.]|nr:hypothetical protein [Bacteroides sp.]
ILLLSGNGEETSGWFVPLRRNVRLESCVFAGAESFFVCFNSFLMDKELLFFMVKAAPGNVGR